MAKKENRPISERGNRTIIVYCMILFNFMVLFMLWSNEPSDPGYLCYEKGGMHGYFYFVDTDVGCFNDTDIDCSDGNNSYYAHCIGLENERRAELSWHKKKIEDLKRLW